MAIGALASIIHAETYRDAAVRFQLDVSPEWKRLPEVTTRAMEQAARSSQAPGGAAAPLSILVAYAKDAGEPPRPPLFVITHVAQSSRGMTVEDVEKVWASGFDSGVRNSINANLTAGSTQSSFDRSKNRLFSNVTISSGDARLVSHSVSYIGADGLVQFTLYSTPEGAATDQAAFDVMLDSFKFDSGAEFVPAAKTPGPKKATTADGRIVVTVAVGLAGVLVLWIAMKARRGWAGRT